MTNVTTITRANDEALRQQLIEALGTENKPDQWLVFMDTVLDMLSVVLSRGRTSPALVQKSLIGRLGFTSWRSMVESSLEDGGLGWNWSAWVAWRRAYKVVQDNPYVREMVMSSSQINKLNQEALQDLGVFPPSLDDFNEWRDSRVNNKDAQTKETVTALKSRIEELERLLDVENKKYEVAVEAARVASDMLATFKSSSRWTFFKAFLRGWK